MEIKQLINKWSLNKVLISSKLGITKGAFNNKLSDKTPQYYLKENEVIEIKKMFKELATDIGKIK